MDAARITRRVRSALRRDAQRLLIAGPPTAPLMPVIGPRVPDDARVQQVLDLCMRVGEVLLSSGESAGETSETMLRLAAAAGLSAVDVDITFTSITMCCHRGNAAAPVTSMRLVRYRTLDLTRLAAVNRIVDGVEQGRLDVSGGASALAEVVAASHPYPRWVATAGWAGLAGSIAALLGAGWSTALVAFVVTAMIDRTGRLLARLGLQAFFLQVAGGLLATGSIIVLFAVGAFPPGTRPALVVAASITVLLSGLSVVGTVQDAIGGYYVTAAGRAAEIALLSAGLLTGVVLGLQLAAQVGVPLDAAGNLGRGTAGVLTGLAASAAASAAFALAGYAPLRALPVAGAAGAAGWGTFVLLAQLAGAGPVPATAGAAMVVGMAAGLVRRVGSVPPLVVVLAGITPLLPGLTAYRGFYQLAVEGVSGGLVTVTLALAVGLAIAGGVAFGDLVTRPGRTPRPSPSEPPPDAEPH
ncbi:MAG TPA: threonine/serine exporter family protein [Pseudonocardia sp.]|nr:threonine/serine exporter family protein [Pseudonocardia sp.]